MRTIRESVVRQAEQRLRKVINTPGIHDRIYEDRKRIHWAQLCSSMDVIGDSDLAIESYLRSRPTKDAGSLYIRAYGLMQVLFVQQDAIINMAEAVSLPYTMPDDFVEIRGLRNAAIGHPTKRGSGKATPLSYGIVRISLRNDSFSLFCFNLERKEPLRDINLKELIAKQKPHIVAALNNITRHVKAIYGQSP